MGDLERDPTRQMQELPKPRPGPRADHRRTLVEKANRLRARTEPAGRFADLPMGRVGGAARSYHESKGLGSFSRACREWAGGPNKGCACHFVGHHGCLRRNRGVRMVAEIKDSAVRVVGFHPSLSI